MHLLLRSILKSLIMNLTKYFKPKKNRTLIWVGLLNSQFNGLEKTLLYFSSIYTNVQCPISWLSWLLLKNNANVKFKPLFLKSNFLNELHTFDLLSVRLICKGNFKTLEVNEGGSRYDWMELREVLFPDLLFYMVY